MARNSRSVISKNSPKSGFIPSVYRVFFKTGYEIQDYALKRLANRTK